MKSRIQSRKSSSRRNVHKRTKSRSIRRFKKRSAKRTKSRSIMRSKKRKSKKRKSLKQGGGQ